MSQDITFMTPGSVWVRDNGKKSTVVGLTNLNLKPKFQEKYPPQAVYLNEEGDLLSQDVESFMSSRTFFNVAPEVESLVDSLFAYREDADEDDEEAAAGFPVEDDGDASTASDSDSTDDLLLEIVGDELSSDTQDEEVKLVASNKASGEIAFVSFSEDAPEEAKAAAAVLNSAVVAYSQAPLINEGFTDHIIEFDRQALAEQGITPQGLEALFDPENDMCLPSFIINGDLRVEWSAYIGVFPKMSKKKTLACLHLGTDSPASVTAQIAQLAASVVAGGDEQLAVTGDTRAEQQPVAA